MEIVSKSIDELDHDPNNVRVHDDKNLKAIRSSLKKFGQQKPIIIDENNIVIAGNGTLEAARSLGWDTIDCVVTTLDDFNKAAFAIADNRTAELATWNFADLEKSLAKFELEGFDRLDLGFENLSWDSPKESPVDKVDENMDGIITTIKVKCPQEIKDEVLIFLKGKIMETSFEGVEVV